MHLRWGEECDEVNGLMWRVVMRQSLRVIVSSVFLFYLLSPCFVYANQQSSFPQKSDPFLVGATEIIYFAHGVMDLKKIETYGTLQESVPYINKGYFEERFGESLRAGLSAHSMARYQISKLRGGAYPRPEKFDSNQIVMELIYDFDSISLEGAYVIGTVSINLWRLVELNNTSPNAVIYQLPASMDTLPATAFIFKLPASDDGRHSVDDAIGRMATGVAIWLNNNSKDM